MCLCVWVCQISSLDCTAGHLLVLLSAMSPCCQCSTQPDIPNFKGALYYTCIIQNLAKYLSIFKQFLCSIIIKSPVANIEILVDIADIQQPIRLLVQL